MAWWNDGMVQAEPLFCGRWHKPQTATASLLQYNRCYVMYFLFVFRQNVIFSVKTHTSYVTHLLD